MGNSLKKPKNPLSPDGTIDGGYARQARASRSIPEYDPRVVQKLILTKKLAPFYDGRPDPPPAPPPSPNTTTTTQTSQMITSDTTINSSSSFSSRSLSKSEKKAFLEQRRRALLQESTAECPICFLRFPPNINKTTCCKQPLCTNCFVNIRKPPSGRVISCPFCNRRDFSIKYESPEDLAIKDLPVSAKKKKKKAKDIPSIKCEHVHLYFSAHHPSQHPQPHPRTTTNVRRTPSRAMYGGGGGLSRQPSNLGRNGSLRRVGSTNFGRRPSNASSHYPSSSGGTRTNSYQVMNGPNNTQVLVLYNGRAQPTYYQVAEDFNVHAFAASSGFTRQRLQQ